MRQPALTHSASSPLQLRQKEMRHKKKVLEENRRKTSKSPFQIDLVAETERIDGENASNRRHNWGGISQRLRVFTEEVMVRVAFEEKLQVVNTKRKEKVKITGYLLNFPHTLSDGLPVVSGDG